MLTFVDAPVLGAKLPAEKGELIVLASGPAEARSDADRFSTPSLEDAVAW